MSSTQTGFSDENAATLIKGWLHHSHFLACYAMSGKDQALEKLSALSSLPGIPIALERVYLFDLCSLANQFSLWEKMSGPLERLEHLSRLSGNNLGLAQSSFFRAAMSINGGKYQEAIDHYQKALAPVRQSGDKNLEGEILNDMGFCCRRLGDNVRGEEHYLESLKIRRKSKNLLGLAESLSNLGTYYIQLKKADDAEAYLLEALKVSKMIGDRIGMGYSYASLGYLAYSRDDYQMAEEYCRQSIRIRSATGDELGLGYCHLLLFHVKAVRDEEDDALANARDAESFFSRAGDENGMAEIKFNLVKFYLERDETQKAEDILAAAAARFSECDSREVKRKMVLYPVLLVLAKGGHEGKAVDDFRNSAYWDVKNQECRLIKSELTAVVGDRKKAKDEYLEYIGYSESLGRKLDGGIARYAYAKIVGDEEGREHLEKALRTFEEIGAHFWARKTRERLSTIAKR